MLWRTQRLRLESLYISQAEAMYAYRSDADTNRYQAWIPNTLEEVKAFIHKQPKTFGQPDTWYQLAIIEEESGTMIGDIGLHFKENDRMEIGITIAKAHQQKGYASECFQVIIDYCFNDLNKSCIWTSLDPKNEASRKLMQRTGFRKVDFKPKSFYLRGEWRDDELYKWTKEDWKRRKKEK